jgi:glycosyltransferase involved in cell wall biosynthesis
MMTPRSSLGALAATAPPAGVPYEYRPAAGPGSLPEASLLTVLEGPVSALLATATAVRNQSFQAFEWIVVAGNGPSEATRMFEDLSQVDPRIRVIGPSDLDATAARQLAADAARSDHLWEIASGDVPEPTAVEQALWALESGVVPATARWRRERASDGLGTMAIGGDRQIPFETIGLRQPFRNRLEKSLGTRRVLLILPWLDVSGVETFAYDLTGQLLERHHQVSVCAMLSGEGRWRARFARLTPDVFRLPAFLKSSDFPRFLLYLIESRNIDVVLTSNSYLAYQFLPFLRSRRPDVAFVDYVHMEAEHWRNGGVGRVSLAYQELLDLTIVSTRHLRRWMVQRGGDADRIEVCHTNVDTSRWNPARFSAHEVRRGLDVPDDAPMLLYAARICPQKRPQLLAEVLRCLARKEGLAFVCVVAGEGPDLPALQQFVAEHGLEGQTRFVGTVTPERMQELESAADILFLPSSYEGLSLTLYEAMAMETVPVAADVGGQRELVTPDCGVLIPLGEDEVDRYAEALRRLLQSPVRRREMAAAGRARVVKDFALPKMGDRMSQLLDRACELARTSPRPAVGQGLGLECVTLAIEYGRLEWEHVVTGRGAAEAAATAENLRSDTRALEDELAKLREAAGVTRLSGEDIARSIGFRRLVQAFAFRLASTSGLTWLRAFRGVGKRVLGAGR